MAFELGEWRVEPELNRISKPGIERRLEPKVMELLLILVERAGSVVTKKEITERLWPGTFVTESSIFRHVSELRRALGDDRKKPRYLQTIPKKGYRLAVPFRELRGVGPETVRRAGRAPAMVPAAAAIATAAAAIALAIALATTGQARREVVPEAPLRVAVLPFRPAERTPSGDAARLANGVGAMLRNKLALIEGFELVEPRGQAEARALDVDAWLSGSVEVTKGHLVVSVELVDPRSGHRRWARRYEGTIEAVATLQNEMVVSMAEEMNVAIAARDERRLAAQARRTARAGAYEAYLRGELFENRVDCSSFERAIALYEEAMRRDEAFVDVYPKLFDALIATSVLGCRPPRPLLAEADALVERAERNGLDPTRLEQSRAALALWRDFDAEAALGRFEAAEVSGSADTEDLSHAMALLVERRFDDGIREAKRCLEALPVDLGENWALGGVLYLAGNYEAAIDQSLATLELYPNYRPALQILALSYLKAGDERRALAVAERAEPPRHEPWARFDAVPAYVYAVTGDEARARAWLREWRDRVEREWAPKWSLALIHAGLGDSAEAQKWLMRAREEGDPWMVVAGIDPAFGPLYDSSARSSSVLRVP